MERLGSMSLRYYPGEKGKPDRPYRIKSWRWNEYRKEAKRLGYRPSDDFPEPRPAIKISESTGQTWLFGDYFADFKFRPRCLSAMVDSLLQCHRPSVKLSLLRYVSPDTALAIVAPWSYNLLQRRAPNTPIDEAIKLDEIHFYERLGYDSYSLEDARRWHVVLDTILKVQETIAKNRGVDWKSTVSSNIQIALVGYDVAKVRSLWVNDDETKIKEQMLYDKNFTTEDIDRLFRTKPSANSGQEALHTELPQSLDHTMSWIGETFDQSLALPFLTESPSTRRIEWTEEMTLSVESAIDRFIAKVQHTTLTRCKRNRKNASYARLLGAVSYTAHASIHDRQSANECMLQCLTICGEILQTGSKNIIGKGRRFNHDSEPIAKPDYIPENTSLQDMSPEYRRKLPFYMATPPSGVSDILNLRVWCSPAWIATMSGDEQAGEDLKKDATATVDTLGRFTDFGRSLYDPTIKTETMKRHAVLRFKPEGAKVEEAAEEEEEEEEIPDLEEGEDEAPATTGARNFSNPGRGRGRGRGRGGGRGGDRGQSGPRKFFVLDHAHEHARTVSAVRAREMTPKQYRDWVNGNPEGQYIQDLANATNVSQANNAAHKLRENEGIAIEYAKQVKGGHFWRSVNVLIKHHYSSTNTSADEWARRMLESIQLDLVETINSMASASNKRFEKIYEGTKSISEKADLLTKFANTTVHENQFRAFFVEVLEQSARDRNEFTTAVAFGKSLATVKHRTSTLRVESDDPL